MTKDAGTEETPEAAAVGVLEAIRARCMSSGRLCRVALLGPATEGGDPANRLTGRTSGALSPDGRVMISWDNGLQGAAELSEIEMID